MRWINYLQIKRKQISKRFSNDEKPVERKLPAIKHFLISSSAKYDFDSVHSKLFVKVYWVGKKNVSKHGKFNIWLLSRGRHVNIFIYIIDRALNCYEFNAPYFTLSSCKQNSHPFEPIIIILFYYFLFVLFCLHSFLWHL